MKLSSKRIAALVILAGALVIALSGVALAAPPWSDASNSWWVSSYDVTESEVATVADGFPDGTFRPGLAVTRGQFAKMAVNGLGVPIADPATATFVDVIPSHRFYVYVEGAYADQIIGGYPTSSGLYYKPDSNITRQQANSILGRYLSQLEIDITGSIHGDVSTYGTLDLWYEAEGEFYLKAFDDWAKVATSHKPTTAYLIYRDIVQGSNGKLNPASTLTRSQAAALILRVKAEADSIKTPPEAPTNLGVAATGLGTAVTYDTATQRYVGNDPTPQITGDTLASRPIAVYDMGEKLVEDSSNAAGKFYTDLPSALTDGLHSFTARVKNENGLVSPASTAVDYLLDTALPTVAITQPQVPGGSTTVALTSNKPEFTATAIDAGSGVQQVVFQCAVKAGTLTWQTISTDYTPESGTNTYVAEWPTSGALADGLAAGQYLLRVVATDKVGNERVSSTVDVTLDTAGPSASITAPLPSSGGTVAYTKLSMPPFTATAVDPAGTGVGASGIAKVEFYYASITAGSAPMVWDGFTLLSFDTTPEYAATYPSGGLTEGRYMFAVRAYDVVGNESPLTSGGSYAPGVTQEVVIDVTAPVISIQSPYGGQTLAEGGALAITWSMIDLLSRPDTVKIEYTLDGSVGSPLWVVLEAATPNDGTYLWTLPGVTSDMEHAQIRITGIDKAGNTGTAISQQFRILDAGEPAAGSPEPVTMLVAWDPDAAQAGADGSDFRATWMLSTSTDIVHQEVYILPAAVTSLVWSIHDPVETLGNTAAYWTGDADLTEDSAGAVLATGSYRIWIVVTDSSGYSNVTKSDPFVVTAE